MEAFKDRMASLCVPAETVDKMITGAPIILRGDLTLGDARRYADAVQDAGGRVTIQEHGYFDESRRMNTSVSIASFQEFTMCPECGLKQMKGEACVKCGFRFDNGE